MQDLLSPQSDSLMDKCLCHHSPTPVNQRLTLVAVPKEVNKFQLQKGRWLLVFFSYYALIICCHANELLTNHNSFVDWLMAYCPATVGDVVGVAPFAPANMIERPPPTTIPSMSLSCATVKDGGIVDVSTMFSIIF
jgi:hypothetical protein